MGELSSAEHVELFCRTPGIHHNMISMLENLTAFISEVRDNEVRLQRRVDDLSNLVMKLRQEVTSLKESAITADKASNSKKSVKERSKIVCTGNAPASVTPCIDQHSVSPVREPTLQFDSSNPLAGASVPEVCRTQRSATQIQN